MRAPWLLASLLLLGCGEGFLPVTYVDGLRILSVKAEPPEIAWENGDIPAESRLASLVADPRQLDEPAREVVVGYLSCTPDPASAALSPCTAVTTLRSPAQLDEHLPADLCEAGEGGERLGPERPFAFLGAERCLHEGGCGPLALEHEGSEVPLPLPIYRLEDDLGLGGLPAGHPARKRGAEVVILAFAVAASAEELAEGVDFSDPCRLSASLMSRFFALFEARENLLALKRLQVRGPDHEDEANVNPSVPGILAAGTPLPAAPAAPWPAAATFERGAFVVLHPRPAPDLLDEAGRPLRDARRQRYTRYRQDGSVVEAIEETWRYSWFSTGGRFDAERTTDAPIGWTTPTGSRDDPLPPGGRTFLYLVVRDGRGGTDWVRREVRVR